MLSYLSSSFSSFSFSLHFSNGQGRLPSLPTFLSVPFLIFLSSSFLFSPVLRLSFAYSLECCHRNAAIGANNMHIFFALRCVLHAFPFAILTWSSTTTTKFLHALTPTSFYTTTLLDQQALTPTSHYNTLTPPRSFTPSFTPTIFCTSKLLHHPSFTLTPPGLGTLTQTPNFNTGICTDTLQRR